jgi:hypothetical protein
MRLECIVRKLRKSTALDGHRRTLSLLDEWQAPPDLSPFFMTRLRARIREDKVKNSQLLPWLRKHFLATALAFASLAVVGISISHIVTSSEDPHTEVRLLAGTAAGDLHYLELNNDLLTEFEMLDELENPD